jgi:hypothetical protein
MDWEPVTLEELNTRVARDLARCSADDRAFFERARVPPVKWTQHPWGDQGGGFWAVAVFEGRVLWFNDIEEGFNVSRFEIDGEIPANEYWCNQDELGWALPALAAGGGDRLGPPKELTWQPRER